MIIFCEEKQGILEVLRVILNKDRENGRTIYSTLEIDDNFRLVNIKDLVDFIDQDFYGLVDCSVVLHSLDIFEDDENEEIIWSEIINKILSYFIVQTRRRNIDLYIVAHSMDILDKRIRHNIDVQLRIGESVGRFIQCFLFDRRSGSRRRFSINQEILTTDSSIEENKDTPNMENIISDYILEVSCLT